MIKDFEVDNQERYLIGIVKSIKEGLTKNGDPFINMEITDKTGSIEVKIWNTSEEILSDKNISSGSFIYSKGKVGEFNNRMQFTIENTGEPNIVNLNDFPDLKAKFKLEDYIPKIGRAHV